MHYIFLSAHHNDALGTQFQGKEIVAAANESTVSLVPVLILLIPSLLTFFILGYSIYAKKGMQGSAPVYVVFVLRIFHGFSLAVMSATVVQVALDSGFSSVGSTATANAFRMLVAAFSIAGAVLADRCLGSIVSSECASLVMLQGLASYAFAIHQQSLLLLFPGLALTAAGIGMFNATLPVLGMEPIPEGEKARRSLFAHQYFLVMMGSMIVGNFSVTATWEVGTWVGPVMALFLGVVAFVVLKCFTQWAETLQSGSAQTGASSNWRWIRLALPAALFIAYYVGQQQHATSWYVQAIAMNRDVPWSSAPMAPGATQAVFYATKFIVEALLTSLVAMFASFLPASWVRCSIGTMIAGLAVFLSAMVQMDHVGASVWLQVPQFVLLGLAEAIFLPAHLEFLSDIAPPESKHLAMSVGILSHFLACAGLLATEPLLQVSGVSIHGRHGVVYLGGIALFQVVAALIFLAWRRKR